MLDIGHPISREEAIKILLDIILEAEEGRRIVVELEVSKGISF